MPQLDITTYASQLFWLFVCFGALYVFMARVSTPLISGVLKEREYYIESALRRSVDLRLQADNLHSEFEAILADNRQQAHEMLVSQVHDITSATESKKKENTAVMAAYIQKSQEEIEKEKEKNLVVLKSEAAIIAKEVIKKLTGVKADKEKIITQVESLFKSEGLSDAK